MIRKEDLQTLMELGLTLLQAKTYLTLVTTGNATIRVIANNSKITKQDIYRIMPELQQKGLTQRIVASQATYQAIPIETAISLLLQRKTRECAALEQKTMEMLGRYKNNNLNNTNHETAQFMIIDEKTLLLRTLDNATNRVQKTIDVAHFWLFTKNMLFKHDFSVLHRAMDRGVKIRWITEAHQEEPKTEKLLRTLTRNPLFKIRYYPLPIPLRTTIYDGKEITMGIYHSPKEWVSSIISNNQMFIKVVANYYEKLWNHSLETPEQRQNSTFEQKIPPLKPYTF